MSGVMNHRHADAEGHVHGDDRAEGRACDNVAGPVGGPLTVGTEDADGTSGQALVNADSGEGIVAEDNVVCFEYTGASLAPVTINYEATVDHEGLSNGDVLTNEVTHITDNPGAQPVTVGVDVTIVVEQAAQELTPTDEPTEEPTPTDEPTDGAGKPIPPDRPGGALPRTGTAVGIRAVLALLLLGAGAGAVRMRRATE